jgi:tRNA uridine 5-carbamoylmethylation protein Kti12
MYKLHGEEQKAAIKSFRRKQEILQHRKISDNEACVIWLRTKLSTTFRINMDKKDNPN